MVEVRVPDGLALVEDMGGGGGARLGSAAAAVIVTAAAVVEAMEDEGEEGLVVESADESGLVGFLTAAGFASGKK